MKRKIMLEGFGTVVLAWGLVSASPASADGFGNDTRSCAADRPCFNGIFQSGDQVIFQFNGIRDWELYNVRYVQGSGRETQVENRSGSFTFTNAQPGRVYRLSVQGCNTHTFARSTCSPWVEASFTTAAPPPPPPASEPVKSLGRRRVPAPSEPIKSLGRTPAPPSSEPVKSLGRTPARPAQVPPICVAAQDARARSSPAAPGLEAQCRAATGGQDTYFRLQLKAGGKYLDAVNCSDQLALNAGSTYAGGACQLWRFVPAGDGWNRLQLKQGGTYLDASYCSDKVVLNGSSTFAGGACQLWRFVPAGDGWSRLQVKQGGKYLDASYCSDQVVLNGSSSYADGACQLWRLVGEPG